MGKRILLFFAGILAWVAGIATLVTGRGLFHFGSTAVGHFNGPTVRFSGPLAYLEGAVFIGFGVYCFARAAKSDPQ